MNKKLWTMVDGREVQPGWIPRGALETRVLMGGRLPQFGHPKKPWKWWGEKWYCLCESLDYGDLWFGPFNSKEDLMKWYNRVMYWGDILTYQPVLVEWN